MRRREAAESRKWLAAYEREKQVEHYHHARAAQTRAASHAAETAGGNGMRIRLNHRRRRDIQRKLKAVEILGGTVLRGGITPPPMRQASSPPTSLLAASHEEERRRNYARAAYKARRAAREARP